MSEQIKLTPEQAVEVLTGVVRHPHLRFLNLAEMETAVHALNVLGEVVKPPTAPTNANS